MAGIPDDLEAAVRDGLITAEQAAALSQRRAAADPGSTEEPFRFVDNFGDIFLCVGLLILLWAPRLFGVVAGEALSAYVDLGFAAVYWIIAEVLTKARRRMPAVLSALIFAWLVQWAGHVLMTGDPTTGGIVGSLIFHEGDGGPFAAVHLLPGLAALVAALVRFRWPILLFCALLVIVFMVFLAITDVWSQTPALWTLALTGLAFLFCGIALDMKDRTRTGRWHEYALWFFVCGSPLTIHPLFIMLLFGSLDLAGNVDDVGLSVATVAIAALTASFLGLLLDRRSLVASSMVYITGALGYLVTVSTPSPELLIGVVPLAIGLLVITMGLGWRPLRRWVMRRLPFQSLLALLPAY